ncbi:MAG: class I SAM-dependent methyltransferase [Kordiimonadaceae bacterium]|nr:class I SAM-dependent methyltransferase [Kordiimonadaceae bacterium]
MSHDQTELRKSAEMEFHDSRERDRREMTHEEWIEKYPNKKWYSVTKKSQNYVDNWLQIHCKQGAKALDFGCGLGSMTIKMATLGASTYSIDISPESVAETTRKSEELGLASRVNAQVMDAENMTFADDLFDVIVCSGVLHHMDVNKAFPEIARVLKPGGKVLAIEALGYNPLINLYRQKTPHLRTDWEKDHILTGRELRIAGNYFDGINVKYWHLAAIGAVLLRKTWLFRPLLAIGNVIDSVILRVPGLQKMAWQMTFVLSEPSRKIKS